MGCSSFFQIIWMLWLAVIVVLVDGRIPIGRPGCSESCENSSVNIPFPFGIGKSCYYNPWYEIVCKNSSAGVQKPFLSKFNIEVLNISSCLDHSGQFSCFEADLTIEVASHWQRICSNGAGNSSKIVSSFDLGGSPFEFSGTNDFLVRGCSGHATVMNRGKATVGGCSTTCSGGNSSTGRNNGTCDGVGCCTIPFTNDIFQLYQIGFVFGAQNTCMEFTLGDWFSRGKIVQLSDTDTIPNVWLWKTPSLPGGLSTLPDKAKNLVCSSICSNNTKTNGCVLCTCRQPFEGNPYIPYGCQDPCKFGTNSSHSCKKPLLSWVAVLGISIGLGSLSLILCCCGVFYLVKRWRLIRKRAKLFKRNGGLLLQQQMTSIEGGVENTKIFTVEELNKATDNFSRDRILGEGGQGTVYKGMLLDGKVVAIKKALNLDGNQLSHFINEVVILTQINHRNIVKLLGCCLETEVPLLVYEFIPNGTLSEHIHKSSEDYNVDWKMRLQIAAEAAEALMYLHSYSNMPIYHRDVKSFNILLDAKYSAKVSDFGTSRTINIDQTHLSTRVQGTYGYLDPEYYQTHQYTDKSDVYSFGVVLVELLTGKKPLFETGTELKNLAGDFLNHMETTQLFDILDTRIDAKQEQLLRVANLAKKCLNISGKLRPTMKDVASTLQEIRSPSISSALDQACPGNNVIVTVN